MASLDPSGGPSSAGASFVAGDELLEVRRGNLLPQPGFLQAPSPPQQGGLLCLFSCANPSCLDSPDLPGVTGTVSTGFKCRSSLTTCAAWAGASQFAFRLPQEGLIKRTADPVGRFAAHSDKMSTSSTSSSKLKSKKFDNCGEVIERMEDLVAAKAIRPAAPRAAGVDFQMTLPLNSMTPRPFCLPRWSFLMGAAGRRFGVLKMSGERW